MGRGRCRQQLLLGLVLAWAASACGYTLQGSQSAQLKADGIERIYVEPITNDTFKPGIENVLYNELVRFISARRRVRLVSRPEDADAILRGRITQASYVPAAAVGSTSQVFPVVPVLPNFERFIADVPVALSYSATLTAGFSLVRSDGSLARVREQRRHREPHLSADAVPSVTQAGEGFGDGRMSGRPGVEDAAASRAGKVGVTPLAPLGSPEVSWSDRPAALEPGARLPTRPRRNATLPEPEPQAILWASQFTRSQPFPGNNQLGVFGNTAALINESEFDRALKEMAFGMMGELHESMLAMF